MNTDLVQHTLRAYAFTDKDKQHLADVLAQGYLLAKARAYERAQSRAGHVVRIRHPWQAGKQDVTYAQTWATQQVQGIADTYITLLSHMLEDETLPEERALADIIGKVKQVGALVSNWIAGFLPWKVKQVADYTWGAGSDDGTKQWASDVSSGDIDGDASGIQLQVLPIGSSNDGCQEFAGNTYSIDEVMDGTFPSFPIHPNCVHSIEVVYPSERFVSPDTKNTPFLFLDIDGVFSIPNADLFPIEIDGKEAWPIPQANALLQALQQDDHYCPIWLTHWGQQANGWNDRANIRHWPVWYPLSAEKEAAAQRLFPSLDKKLLAAQYCMYVNGISSAVWLQDGFAPEEEIWAKERNVRLIDANEEHIHALLLSHDLDAVNRLVVALTRGGVMI